MQTGEEGPQIQAISDGRAGNARQAAALAQAAARRLGGRVEEVTTAPAAPFHFLPPALTPLAAVPLFYRAGPVPDLAVGCGRRVAPYLAWLRRRGAAAAQILNPQMRLSAFDLVVAPRHDGLSGTNLAQVLGGLNDLDEARLAATAETQRARLAHLPSPRVAVLIGGPSRSADFSATARATLRDGLRALAARGAGLMITPSRRTPPDLLAELEGLGWVWDGTGDNPYPGILGLADAVVVTADSVNMASEAAASGKPVFISAVDRLSPKHNRFHAALAAHGATEPFTGALADWVYPPLREAETVAARLVEIMRRR